MGVINLHWPFVIVVTLLLYVFVLVGLLFNKIFATVMLLLLIAYWSRLPGVGISSPFFVLYHADLVDLLSLIVAVNVGGIYGAVFSVFGNLASRIAGFTPPWNSVIKDTVMQFLICLIIPIAYSFTSNIFLCMLIYTILRRIGFIIGYFIYPHRPLIQFAMIWLGNTICSLIINAFYAQFFGPFFDSLWDMRFNWILFIIVTMTIIIAAKIMGFRVMLIDARWLIRLFFKGSKTQKKESHNTEAIIDDVMRAI